MALTTPVRYNGLLVGTTRPTIAAAIDNLVTTIPLGAALTYNGNQAVPTTADPNFFRIVLEPDTPAMEVCWAQYTAGAFALTVLRGQEGTTKVPHGLNAPWVHAPTASDFPPLVPGAIVAVGDTAAQIQAKADACATGGTTLVIPDGTWTLTSKVTFRCHVQASAGALFLADLALAVQLGDDTTILSNMRMVLPKVERITNSWSAGNITTDTGIAVFGIYSSDITIPDVAAYGIGLSFIPAVQGCSYNKFRLGALNNNAINLLIQPSGSGYVNENQFFGGRYQHSSSNGTNVTGTRQIKVVYATHPPNNNIWFGGSVEGDVAEYHLDCDGYYNQFNNLRWEAATPKVNWGTNAQYNVLFYGYQAENIVETDASTGRNHRYDRSGVRHGSARGGYLSGPGTPETFITAPVGTVWGRSDGGAGTSFYVKESGTGNTGWVAVGPAADVQVFATPGSATWTKPTNPRYKTVDVFCQAGGGGGGSGRKGATGTVRAGGGGGGGGGFMQARFAIGDLGATETLTVGAAGAAGAAQTTNSTNGNAGGAGGDSSFGSGPKSRALGGGGGGAGSTTAGTAGSSGFGGISAGSAGGAGSIGAAAGAGTSAVIAGTGGGGGGGVSAAEVNQAGGFSGNRGVSVLGSAAGGTAGGGTGAAGAAGNLTSGNNAGSGGGGGGSSTSGNGGDGGAGGGPSGGGGGGGGATDAVGNSGNGGVGAQGLVVVVTR